MPFYGLVAHFFLALDIIHCLDVPQFIHSPTEGHLGGFRVFAIMNKAAINIHVQVFTWIYAFIPFWVNNKKHD